MSIAVRSAVTINYDTTPDAARRRPLPADWSLEEPRPSLGSSAAGVYRRPRPAPYRSPTGDTGTDWRAVDRSRTLIEVE
ncbi:hypothetical protein EL22_15940 [Halostagnicola sp. A56]|nr:hypothetical protein EL22_15940 [Halostagnicola sp. A56]